MKTTASLLATAALFSIAGGASAATFITFNNRADFLDALDATLIDDNLNRYNNDIDFENTTVNTVSPGNPLLGFDVSHSGDEITTQFVNGTLTNMANTGNPTPDLQFLLDLAGVPGAFGSNSNQADTGTITVQTAGVNAFGFDAFGFNDQGQSFLVDPGTLGNEMGVITKVLDSAGNMQDFTIQASDAFFGVITTAPGATIEDIVFSATTTYANSGTEFIAMDNFIGGSSSVPEPATAMMLALAGVGVLVRRQA
ncbi:hypothetical protein MalM25_31530 [Planctomycetes bacterium MalM25]|nr:hypothetical protein MalM25_31530 [Planctomycetes bacterium MalM25]